MCLQPVFLLLGYTAFAHFNRRQTSGKDPKNWVQNHQASLKKIIWRVSKEIEMIMPHVPRLIKWTVGDISRRGLAEV